MTILDRIRDLTRRDVLRVGAAGAALALVGAGCGDDAGGAGPDDVDASIDPVADAALPRIDATPGCTEEVTEDNLEGPFYKEGAPVRDDLTEADMLGTRLEISGRVLSIACVPLAGALVDVWQSDWRGEDPSVYDSVGFILRGRVYAAADGAWRLRTIIPGRYPNGNVFRPAHIHVKVSAPGHELITTQLYFDGDPFNATDPFFEAPLLMTLTDAPGGEKRAFFDLVLRAV